MINVTLIGFGYVGSSLSFLLMNNKHSLRLNIMEPNPQCEGALLDLAHGSSLYHEKELHINDETLFQNADFIFYAAGAPNVHGGSRLSTAKQNKELSDSIFTARTFVNDPYVIVITNPVDFISYTVLQYSGIPQERVIGTGTFLENVRLAYYLSKHSGIPITDFETLVLGEHGDSQVAIYSQCSINGEPLLNHSSFSAENLTQIRVLTRDAAFQIRETQEGTSYGVAKCAEMIFNYLLDGGKHKLSLSVRTNEYYRSLLNLNRNIYIGLPVIIDNGTIQLNNTIQLSDEELQDLQASASILEAITNEQFPS